MNCIIITIGDELLIGQVIDTNSAWLARELNALGIAVTRRVSVGDDWQAIWQALDNAIESAELVLITGGLGPTADDITKPLLCQYFGGKLIVNDQVLAHVRAIFERINSDRGGKPRPMLERNLKQAEVPDVCEVLHNPAGTAPGMLFQKNGTMVISMPGVPHEMKEIMRQAVLPRLRQNENLGVVEHRTLLTAGQGESYVAERIQAFENALPKHIRLAYLPSYGMVRLRLTGIGTDRVIVEEELDQQFEKLKQEVFDLLVTDRDEQLHQVVLRLLAERGETLAMAESCTGGYMAHLVTQIPGSSSVFMGSAVVYSNAAKHSVLGVPIETIEQQGAVSEAVVRDMVEGCLLKFGSRYAMAVSGIMGPGGGSDEKPVGTVWIAVGNAHKIEAQQMRFRFDRHRNIELTANYAFNLLRLFMLRQ